LFEAGLEKDRNGALLLGCIGRSVKHGGIKAIAANLRFEVNSGNLPAAAPL
jgi:hypothetical protein